LLTILGISYIQPFEDGNKRTGRLLANALLLSHNLAPLSYRSVDENEYRQATIVFYELNSIMPFKRFLSNNTNLQLIITRLDYKNRCEDRLPDTQYLVKRYNRSRASHFFVRGLIQEITELDRRDNVIKRTIHTAALKCPPAVFHQRINQTKNTSISLTIINNSTKTKKRIVV